MFREVQGLAQTTHPDSVSKACFSVWNSLKHRCGVFLKSRVPPDHPKLDHFSVESYGLGGSPMVLFMAIPISIRRGKVGSAARASSTLRTICMSFPVNTIGRKKTQQRQRLSESGDLGLNISCDHLNTFFSALVVMIH